MTLPLVNLNGAILPAAEARVAALDHSFLYGAGLFETVRLRPGGMLGLQRHLDRLETSANALGLRLPSRGALLRALWETAAANDVAECVLRLTVSPGTGEPHPDAAPEGPPQYLVTARPAPPPPDPDAGLRAVVTGPHPGLAHKTTSYLPFILARRAARLLGADEALLTREGRIVEAATGNVFAIRDGVLHTPPLADGCLPGITRGFLLDLAEAAAVPTREAALSPAELGAADEAFLTNAVIGVAPLLAVDGREIGDGGPGSLTRRLRTAYGALADG
jgi:branched-chain amino acid aminotransferase